MWCDFYWNFVFGVEVLCGVNVYVVFYDVVMTGQIVWNRGNAMRGEIGRAGNDSLLYGVDCYCVQIVVYQWIDVYCDIDFFLMMCILWLISIMCDWDWCGCMVCQYLYQLFCCYCFCGLIVQYIGEVDVCFCCCDCGG